MRLEESIKKLETCKEEQFKPSRGDRKLAAIKKAIGLLKATGIPDPEQVEAISL
jgi:hypothetical protein